MLGWLSKILGWGKHTHQWTRYPGSEHKRVCQDCGLVQWVLTPGEEDEHPRWRDSEHEGD